MSLDLEAFTVGSLFTSTFTGKLALELQIFSLTNNVKAMVPAVVGVKVGLMVLLLLNPVAGLHR